jgi:hypothetical protein
MKRIQFSLVLGLALTCLNLHAAKDWQAGMKEGKPDVKSISQLAFGPEGILFIADTKAAAVVAIALGDTKPSDARQIKVEGVNQKVAALLGSSADQIVINDMVVNPVSRNAYLAVSRGRGADALPVLIRAKTSGELEVVSLDKVKFSRAELPEAPADAVAGQGNRQRNPRQESITDIAFFQDSVLVAGLSNEEFASTLRSISFPFEAVTKPTSVEIYHGAHGAYETRSPIRTFVAYNVGNQPSLLAAYTCTPLVQFPISDIKPGSKIRGKTIAELGNWNRPLDMVVYQKDGKDYVLMANSARGIMKISTEKMESAQSITSRVADTQGQPYETISSWTGVDQLDKLDAQYALVVRRAEGDVMNLESIAFP